MSADPTPYVAACWALSALTLGGFVLHAWLADRRR